LSNVKLKHSNFTTCKIVVPDVKFVFCLVKMVRWFSSYRKRISELWSITCHMGSPSVTCHPSTNLSSLLFSTQAHFCRLHPL